MDFKLSDEAIQLRDSVRRFAVESFGGDDFAGGREQGFRFDRAQLLARSGFTGIDFPVDDGGQGGSLLDAAIVMSEIARASPHAGDIVQAFNFGGIRQLQRLGTRELKEQWLAPALRGELLVSVAMTEPDAGSDLTRLALRAQVDGDRVTLNGQKIFSSHGLDSQLLVVWCRFGDRVQDIGAVLVPTDTPGFQRGPAEEYMSGERYCSMYFDDCVVPASHILADGDGFKRMMPVFNVERLGNATRALALAKRAFEEAVVHATQREAFGQKLAEHQGLRWKFADMRMRLDAAELLLYRAITEVGTDGFPTDEYSSIAKCYVNEAAFFVADQALQIFGGYGYTTQYPVEYIFRRTRGWMIAGGSVEILRNRIAKRVLDPARS